MKKEIRVGHIYKDDNGEYFRSIERGGRIVLKNPSYPFAFRVNVLKSLELIGDEKEFGHLVTKKDYTFIEGDTLTLKVGKEVKLNNKN